MQRALMLSAHLCADDITGTEIASAIMAGGEVHMRCSESTKRLEGLVYLQITMP